MLPCISKEWNNCGNAFRVFLLEGISIKGSISSTKEDLKKALELSKSLILPVIGGKIQLSDINKGYKDMLDRNVFGRLLIQYK